MQALVLAAGEGTRLRPLTLDRPKPMLPIGSMPLLEHIVRWLSRYGVVDIALNLHYRPETIVEHFGTGARWDVTLTYSFEEQLLGTAGAAKKLERFFTGPFVLVYGDVFTDLDLGRLIACHQRWRLVEPEAVLTMALYRVDNPSACGLVETDAAGRIRRFVEKPPPAQVFTDLANAGVMVMEASVLESIPPQTVWDYGHDLLPQLLEEGRPMMALPIADHEFLVDIGTPAGYQRAQAIWQAKAADHGSGRLFAQRQQGGPS